MRRTVASCAWWVLLGVLAQADAQPSQPTQECDAALSYQTADAHPAIRWVSVPQPATASAPRACVLVAAVDDGSVEMKAYMSSGLYRFVRECRTDASTVHRLFEYKNGKRPYFLRWHANPFLDLKTFVVVTSQLMAGGNYVHSVREISNKGSRIKLCPPGRG